MNKTEISTARQKLGLTQDQMGVQLGDGATRYSARTVRSWESGARDVPPAVAKLVKIMLRAKEIA